MSVLSSLGSVTVTTGNKYPSDYQPEKTMNKDNAAQFLPLVQALAEGKEVQMRSSDGAWHSPSFFCFSDPEKYRIKPQKKRVPFCAADVPPGSVIRWPNWGETSYRNLLEVYDSTGVMMIRGGKIEPHSWNELMDDGWLIKRPGQTEWQPCSKEVEE